MQLFTHKYDAPAPLQSIIIQTRFKFIMKSLTLILVLTVVIFNNFTFATVPLKRRKDELFLLRQNAVDETLIRNSSSKATVTQPPNKDSDNIYINVNIILTSISYKTLISRSTLITVSETSSKSTIIIIAIDN
ncbi:80_t:CDS:2 [Ambispora gerdemannii]|uniref:80_t:CDS:1 n=1 Tax=Ambispora gerdemannii TaxID=144530 RepID=A0A9N9CPA2_9GLOM|nr:80_t:CDS:2 [Ambispora gerdemannii]